MTGRLLTAESSRFRIFSCSPIDADSFIEAFENAQTIPAKGRGSISVFHFGGMMVASRKYIHGGLFRALTGDCFLTPKRALREMAILSHLSSRGVPVVEPLCVLSSKEGLRTRLYLATIYVTDTIELVEYLKGARKRERLRMVRKVARLFADLHKNGVFHRDLHLRNILVRRDGEPILLDFDGASRKKLTDKDQEWMFWRLYRYTLKLARRGSLSVNTRELALFGRTYKELTGCDILSGMVRKLAWKTARFKLGWFIENMFYGGKI